MSGGTDSSVSAILLQEAGYEVTGITFRFYEKDDRQEYLADASELAERLGIKHMIVDARKRFREKVITPFIEEYMAGRTPVPCVTCNNNLKWKLLSEAAHELNAGHIACGHYANIACIAGNYYITAGKDSEKDQSFFLWGLSQEILRKIIFPLGELTKQEVREIAAAKGFEKIATKKDSMGICFCPGDYRSFLRQHVSPEKLTPGFFEDENGKILGKHAGYPFYTIGQRRKLGINLQKPVFVKALYPETNRVVLSEFEALKCSRFEIKDYNIIDMADFRKPVICKVRYRKQATLCTVKTTGNDRLEVSLLEPVPAIVPGQSAVFYEGDRVLGGGIIT
ncbi:MAG: tRNA 2-thiouridine(34) synthase MnmA [Candidatus Azobacteroides sp.]|nr:tRNA 2-thiouridine(34) synthase MnmA [Candidatus Azobacteroides sp.]